MDNYEFLLEKLESLGYFSLGDCMDLSPVILVLWASESPIFRFGIFWGPKPLDGFHRRGINLYQPSGHDNPVICADCRTGLFRCFDKLRHFEMIIVQSCHSGVDKNCSKQLKILRFLIRCKI